MKTKEEKTALADARILTVIPNKTRVNKQQFTLLLVRYMIYNEAVSGIIFSKEGNFECAFTSVS